VHACMHGSWFWRELPYKASTRPQELWSSLAMYCCASSSAKPLSSTLCMHLVMQGTMIHPPRRPSRRACSSCRWASACHWRAASAQSSGAQELRSQQCRQGSSWVSGLLVGVCQHTAAMFAPHKACATLKCSDTCLALPASHRLCSLRQVLLMRPVLWGLAQH